MYLFTKKSFPECYGFFPKSELQINSKILFRKWSYLFFSCIISNSLQLFHVEFSHLLYLTFFLLSVILLFSENSYGKLKFCIVTDKNLIAHTHKATLTSIFPCSWLNDPSSSGVWCSASDAAVRQQENTACWAVNHHRLNEFFSYNSKSWCLAFNLFSTSTDI